MKKRTTLIVTAIATFFFGFGAGAILNLYLIFIHSPLIEKLRGSLNYTSSIFGDGILLPIVNMVMVSFLYDKKEFITKKTLGVGLFGGLLITAYFHISQALQGLVNWAMPTPWHWNFLGLWHGIYMLSVTSLITLFFTVSFLLAKRERNVAKEFFIVALGLIIFLFLLRIDYLKVSLISLFPHKL